MYKIKQYNTTHKTTTYFYLNKDGQRHGHVIVFDKDMNKVFDGSYVKNEIHGVYQQKTLESEIFLYFIFTVKNGFLSRNGIKISFNK